VNQTRFLNTSQPQTLVIGTILLYIDAFFALIYGFPAMLIAIAMAAGAFGIANERKWGYTIGLAGAILQLVTLVAFLGLAHLLDGLNFLTFVFDAALVGLLLHPMSRDYTKIWFR
jgi:hypothetical protein